MCARVSSCGLPQQVEASRAEELPSMLSEEKPAPSRGRYAKAGQRVLLLPGSDQCAVRVVPLSIMLVLACRNGTVNKSISELLLQGL
jgi:hypothetical protein